MEVKVVSLQELLAQLLGTQGHASSGLTSEVDRKIKQRMANIERYKKNVVEQIGEVTREVLEIIGMDHCDHPGHHMVPQHVNDMQAVYNVLEYVHRVFHHAYSLAIQETVDCANRMLYGDGQDIPPDAKVDALHSVVKQLLSILVEELHQSGDKPNAIEIMRTVTHRLPEVMAQMGEQLITGKDPVQQRESGHACKH